MKFCPVGGLDLTINGPFNPGLVIKYFKVLYIIQNISENVAKKKLHIH